MLTVSLELFVMYSIELMRSLFLQCIIGKTFWNLIGTNKPMRIIYSRGIVLSQIITSLLQEDFELNEFLSERKEEVYVYALRNGREQGFSYSVSNRKTKKTFTWCVYEHRNSDVIIINGKDGYLTDANDLPYKGDKNDYLSDFGYDEYAEAAKFLAGEITTFLSEGSDK